MPEPTPRRPEPVRERVARSQRTLLIIHHGRQIPAHPSPGISMRSLRLLAVLSLAAASSLAAQDTPTEREAAKDVLKKMAALEQSLDVPGWVTKLTVANPARDQVAARAKELMDKELLAMGDDLTRHPEIGFVEYESVKKLTDYLKAHDFDVEMGVGGLKTAFIARYRKNNGAPNLGIILEYDALRGTKGAFAGDQHSTQGPIGMAAGIAMAEYLTKNHLPGSVIMYGTPGEEMMPPAAKTEMFKAGVFKDDDVAPRAGVRQLLPEHQRHQVHVQRRAGAPDDGVERPQRAHRRDSLLRQHRRHPEQHPAGVAGAGHHHRGRRGAERRPRPHGGGFLHSVSGRDLPRAAHEDG